MEFSKILPFYKVLITYSAVIIAMENHRLVLNIAQSNALSSTTMTYPPTCNQTGQLKIQLSMEAELSENAR